MQCHLSSYPIYNVISYILHHQPWRAYKKDTVTVGCTKCAFPPSVKDAQIPLYIVHVVLGSVTPSLSHLSVNGVMTSLGVFPRYSWLYRNSASQMFAKQSSSFLSHLQTCCLSKVVVAVIVIVVVLLYPVFIVSLHIDLCLSWDCQAKAALDSTFLLTTSRLSIWSNTTSTYLIIPPTTSRECTSIVQIVITWWLK